MKCHKKKCIEHNCFKVLTEISEVWPIFKGDLIKFCEILIKMTLKLYQIVKSLYLNE